MSKYEFQSVLHRSAREMALAIAQEWLTAGGANSAAVIREEILPGATAESMADEAIAGWGLDPQWMAERDTERADLIAAFEEAMEEYRGLAPIASIDLIAEVQAEDAAGQRYSYQPGRA